MQFVHVPINKMSHSELKRILNGIMPNYKIVYSTDKKTVGGYYDTEQFVYVRDQVARNTWCLQVCLKEGQPPYFGNPYEVELVDGKWVVPRAKKAPAVEPLNSVRLLKIMNYQDSVYWPKQIDLEELDDNEAHGVMVFSDRKQDHMACNVWRYGFHEEDYCYEFGTPVEVVEQVVQTSKWIQKERA